MSPVRSLKDIKLIHAIMCLYILFIAIVLSCFGGLTG